MHRFLTLLLLLILPLQFSWAAAASYCAHETKVAAPQAAHLGHHEHQHEPAATQASQLSDPADAAGKSSSIDEDCFVCHLSCVMPLISVSSLAFPMSSAVHQPTLCFIFESHVTEVPLRPDCSRTV